jgi:hypothetical protein
MPPQNYVQQLASALGLNNSNMTSTDFESLIEMNRRQQQQQQQLSVSSLLFYRTSTMRAAMNEKKGF